MKCPHCGTENQDQAKFCSGCGEKFLPGNTPKPSVSADGAAPTADTKAIEEKHNPILKSLVKWIGEGAAVVFVIYLVIFLVGIVKVPRDLWESNIMVETKREVENELLAAGFPPENSAEMAPTKSNDRILPITEETLPYFLRQFDLIERQRELIAASDGEYYDNKLFIAKPDGSPQRRDRMSANFG